VDITQQCESDDGIMILATNDELLSEVIDADDCRYTDENDQRQEQLETYEGRHLSTEVLVPCQLLAYLHQNNSCFLTYVRHMA